MSHTRHTDKPLPSAALSVLFVSAMALVGSGVVIGLAWAVGWI